MNEQFLETILALSTGKNSRIHGPAHWAGVAAAGHTLCELTPEADRRVVLAFAMLHDSMRETDGLDPDHGARAAELAESLHESGDLELDAEQLSTLTEALTYHDKGRTSGDPTIGACWDSDRLNLYRVGITPKASLMSTEGGCSLAGTEWSKYFPSFRFAWPAIFLNYDALVGLGEPSEHITQRAYISAVRRLAGERDLAICGVHPTRSWRVSFPRLQGGRSIPDRRSPADARRRDPHGAHPLTAGTPYIRRGRASHSYGRQRGACASRYPHRPRGGAG